MLDRSFFPGRCGPDSIVAGLQSILDGENETVTWVASQHPREGNEVYATITIGRAVIDGVLTWRYCGEGRKPDSAGSHALCASGDSQDLALAAARLACLLGSIGTCIFRQN